MHLSSRVEDKAPHMPPRPDSTPLERIGAQISSSADVSHVFSEPITKDGMTVIPVAKVRWGFGGGGSEHPGSGGGGGGGMTVQPIGYLILKSDRVTYKPILDLAFIVQITAVVGLSAALIMGNIRKIIRRK